MSSNAMTSATTKVYIAAGQTPSTYNSAGFAALTWVEIDEVTNIGELGGTTTVVQHIPVGTAEVVKRAGSVNYGTLQCQAARTTAAVQDSLRTVFGTRASTPFKVVYPTALGEIDYFTGIVTSVVTSVQGADNILGLNFTIDIDAQILTV
jgi:hypothetical protein